MTSAMWILNCVLCDSTAEIALGVERNSHLKEIRVLNSSRLGVYISDFWFSFQLFGVKFDPKYYTKLDWSRKLENRTQKSEVGTLKSELRSQKSEVETQKSEVPSQLS